MCFKTYKIFSKAHALWEGISEGRMNCPGESNTINHKAPYQREAGSSVQGDVTRKQRLEGCQEEAKSEGMQGTPRSSTKQANRFSLQSLQNEPALMTPSDSDLDL